MFAEPGSQPRLHREILAHEVGDDHVYSCWSAGPGIVVHTLLTGGAPWHVRLHRVIADRPVVCHENGFAVGDWDALRSGFDSGEGFARVEAAEGVSAIHDLGHETGPVRRRRSRSRPTRA